MIKKEYMKPIMQVVKVLHQSHLLAGSLTSVQSSGLDEDLEYNNTSGDQGYAW